MEWRDGQGLQFAMNIVHPFREGNGRTIREFIRLMAKKCGYRLNWGLADKNDILEASILSVDDYRILIDLLKQIIE